LDSTTPEIPYLTGLLHPFLDLLDIQGFDLNYRLIRDNSLVL
jgi:hypothetical protein